LIATPQRAAVESISSRTARKKEQLKSAVEIEMVQGDGAQRRKTEKRAFHVVLLVSDNQGINANHHINNCRQCDVKW